MRLNNIDTEVLLRGLLSMPVVKENATQPVDFWNRRISYCVRGNAKEIAGITTLKAWVGLCSSDAVREPVEYIRSISNENERKEAKTHLPMGFPCAVFSTRKREVPLEEKLLSYSGVICLDYDFHDTNEARAAVEELRKVPYIGFVGLSVSGAGVYAFAATDNTDYTQHGKYWRAVSEDIAESLGYENDEGTKDVTRGRFISYNPNPIINEAVVPFSLPEGYEEPAPVDFCGWEDTGEYPVDDAPRAAVEDCVRQWEDAGLILGDSTRKIRWLLGTALKKGLGEEGFVFYERICAGYTHPRTPRQEFDGWADAGTTNGKKPIGLGTFFYVLEHKFGIKPRKKEYHLPLDELNPEISDIAREVAEVYQCPPDFAIVAMYAATAAVAGKKFKLWDGKHTNFPQIWAAIVAPSGTGKTEALRWFFEPVEAIEKERYGKYRLALKEWKDGGEKDRKPTLRRCTAVDTTPEVRDQILAENPNGLCLRVDELKGFFDDVGRYNKSGEVGRLLSDYSNESYTIDRKTQEPLRIEKPVLSIVGTIQPGIFALAFGGQQFTGNGFLSRWCFVWNDSHPARRYSDLSVKPETRAKWAEIIEVINQVEGEIVFLLSQPARDLYEAYYNELEDKIHRTQDDNQKECFAKLQITVLRWALITAILGGEYEESLGCGEIGVESMEYAIACSRYFEITGVKAAAAVRGQSPQLTKKDLLRGLFRAYPNASRSLVAKAIGTSMPYLSKVLK